MANNSCALHTTATAKSAAMSAPPPAADSINTLLCYPVHWQAVTGCAVIHLVGQVVGGQVGGKLPGDGGKGRPVGWHNRLMLSLMLILGGEAWEATECRWARCSGCCCRSSVSVCLQLGVVETERSTMPLVTCGGSCTAPCPSTPQQHDRIPSERGSAGGDTLS